MFYQVLSKKESFNKVYDLTVPGVSSFVGNGLIIHNTSATRIVGKGLACYNPTILGEGCQVCPSCQSIDADTSHNYLELDAASKSGVAEIRNLIQEMSLSPSGESRYRTIALDEAHMLTVPAQNALLKCVEEPSPYTHIIFITTNPEKLLSTIRSRCITVTMKVVDRRLLIALLEKVCAIESVAFESSALELITMQSKGHARDALTLAEKVSLAGPLSMLNVRRCLHLDVDESVARVLLKMGTQDWDEIHSELDLLAETCPPSAIWESVNRIITQAEVARLSPGRGTYYEYTKVLVERYGPRILVAAEWLLDKGKRFGVRVIPDLIVGLSSLNDQLGKGNVVENVVQKKQMRRPRRFTHAVNKNDPDSTIMTPQDFMKGLDFNPGSS
jgi:DNA polymerase III subunit gamma/tau